MVIQTARTASEGFDLELIVAPENEKVDIHGHYKFIGISLGFRLPKSNESNTGMNIHGPKPI